MYLVRFRLFDKARPDRDHVIVGIGLQRAQPQKHVQHARTTDRRALKTSTVKSNQIKSKGILLLVKTNQLIINQHNAI